MPAAPVKIVPSDRGDSRRLPGIAADCLASAIERAVTRSGRCNMALSGGSTPVPVYQELACRELPWASVHIWQTDERIVPDQLDRAWQTIDACLLKQGPALWKNCHPFQLEKGKPSAVAAQYERDLRAVLGEAPLDIAFLGLGRDGHTASVFTPDMPHQASAPPVVSATGPYEGAMRVTLTESFLARARERMIIATGAGKAAAVHDLCSGGDMAAIPRRILGRGGLLLVDHAAAGLGDDT